MEQKKEEKEEMIMINFNDIPPWLYDSEHYKNLRENQKDDKDDNDNQEDQMIIIPRDNFKNDTCIFNIKDLILLFNINI